MTKGRDNGRGFSLVELLVVIVIVFLLMSIMMPSLKKSISTAKQVTCQSKLRDMGTGLQLFLADNKHYPKSHVPGIPGSNQVASTTWAEYIYPYMYNRPPPSSRNEVGTEFSCPEAILSKTIFSRIPLSYQANTRVWLEGGADNNYLRMADVPVPAKTLAVADARQSRWTFIESNSHQLRSPATILDPDEGLMPHFNQNNFLFADGHVVRMHVYDTMTGRNNNDPRKYWTPDPND